MQDKLIIITRLKKTIEYSEKVLENFPNKYLEYKKNIINNMYDMLEHAYLANYGLDFNKNKIICLSKLNIIDYYFKLSYKKNVISKKQYENLSKNIYEIVMMINSWGKSFEKKE